MKVLHFIQVRVLTIPVADASLSIMSVAVTVSHSIVSLQLPAFDG